MNEIAEGNDKKFPAENLGIGRILRIHKLLCALP
jgi:hypothetical protein